MTIETESSGQTAGNQAVRQVSGPSRRPSGTSLGVAGRTEINWCHKPKQMSFLKISCEHLAQRNQVVQQVWPRFRGWAAPCRGLGPGPTRAWGPVSEAWGPGPQALGARASPGKGLAKGWESAVGAWREAGTGYPPP